MKVVFLHVNLEGNENRPAHHYQKESDILASFMVESVRKAIPEAEVVQLTDEKTPAIDGCEVVRRPWTHGNPMVFRMEHYSEIEGEFLSLDTDCVVQHDVSGVFSLPFDVALTFREGPVLDPRTGADLAKVMPFNTGVVFTRNNGFWKKCLAMLPEKNLGWYSDQLVISRVVRDFNVLKLHSDNFNYTPTTEGEDVSDRLIVHYKGIWRKAIYERAEVK